MTRNPFSVLHDWIGRATWALAAVGGGACLAAILVITVATVYGRYVLQSDVIPGGYNMIESVFFPLLVFWGLPMAHRDGQFPRLELLQNWAPGAVGKAISAFVLMIEVIVYSVVLWYCWKFAMAAMASGRQFQIGTGFWLAWPVAIMAPLSFALMLVEVVRLMLRDARAAFGG